MTISYKNHCDTCGGSFYARTNKQGEFIPTLSYQNHINSNKHKRGGLLYQMEQKRRESLNLYKQALSAKIAEHKNEKEKLLIKLSELEETIECIQQNYPFTKFLAEKKDEPRDESMDNNNRDSCLNGGEDLQSVSVQ